MTDAVETGQEDDYISPPVLRAAKLLRHIAGGDRVTNMARTARALGINRTTLLRLLRTLEAERFIEQAGDAPGYRIGVGLVSIAAQCFYSDDVVQIAQPVAARLSAQLGLASHLAVLDGREAVYVVRRAPNHALVSNVQLGSRVPAHAGVMGRIMLAFLPEPDVVRLFAGATLDAVTPHTPRTMEQLLARLASDRADGLAWSDGFFEAGVSAVAAPIFGSSGSPVAALNVSGASAAFAEPLQRARIGKALREAADEISRRLGWTGHEPPAVRDVQMKVVA